jgi:hypothetical protein
MSDLQSEWQDHYQGAIRDKSTGPSWADCGGRRSRLFAHGRITYQFNGQIERQAIEDAMRLLSVLKNEMLRSTIAIETEQRR